MRQGTPEIVSAGNVRCLFGFTLASKLAYFLLRTLCDESGGRRRSGE